MTVTVWHVAPDRVLYRIIKGVDRVAYYPEAIALYANTPPKEAPEITVTGLPALRADFGRVVAVYGPGYCWAIETEDDKR